ncbi:histone-lysine N-methyltransferase, H3 lysine-79 specific [Trichomycterus rosablanca]|uniref:histone-lysine N-methyltransferase, H3 lysine-79 specific n=1 Tax=Trichomycterus rosablanca TaxID=2290929 RepID=UPI002F35EFE2
MKSKEKKSQHNNNKMENGVGLTLEVGTVPNFKWTDANTADLILWRVSNTGLFTGRKNTALRAFELFVKEKRLEGRVTPAWVKKKWENLRQKYKDIKSLSMMGGDPLVAPWKWYAGMDQALSGELSVAHSLLSNMSNSFSVPMPTSNQDGPPAKKRREQYWLAALQELERRQEERERRAAEREEERERRAADREEERERRASEREEERERQAIEREKRREQELLTRQERWEMELVAREEKREREYREREERRDQEAAGREDRLFKLLETFMSKQYNMH